MDVGTALAHRRGAATRADLFALGVTRAALDLAVRRGAVVRPYRGIYALAGASPVSVECARLHAEPTCLTLLGELGLPVMGHIDRPHLRVDPERTFSGRHREPKIASRLHWSERPEPGLDAVRTALGIASACTTPREHLALIDGALARMWITRHEIARLPHAPIARARWLARWADGRAGSGLETFARVAITSRGMKVRSQVEYAGVGRVDLLVNGAVVVEADGRSYHSDSSAFANDRRRDRMLQLAGLAVMRFTYDDIVREPERVADEVARAVRLIRQRRTGGLHRPK